METKSNSTVTYNPDTKSLTVNHVWNENAIDGGLNDLYDVLGDHDIITANEINEGGNTLLLSSGTDLYFLCPSHITTLKETGSVELDYYSPLDDYIDKNNENHVSFIKWLRGGEDSKCYHLLTSRRVNHAGGGTFCNDCGKRF